MILSSLGSLADSYLLICGKKKLSIMVIVAAVRKLDHVCLPLVRGIYKRSVELMFLWNLNGSLFFFCFLSKKRKIKAYLPFYCFFFFLHVYKKQR